jgi:sugar (pentulose or hexulose) kinase
MDTQNLILAIDNGTQSLKALIFDPQGTLVYRRQVSFEPYFSRHPGWAEQDPEVFWQALCEGCRSIREQRPELIDRLIAVSLTTQRGTLTNVDKAGRPLRPAILWLDQRKTLGLPPVGGWWGAAFLLTGLRETIAYLQTEAEVNWLRTYEPDIWQRTHKYLLLSGFLTHRLVGQFVDSVGCQVGYIPFDYKRLQWARNWDWKWIAAPVEKEKLPRLIPPTEALGCITPAAAEETGLPAGLPLIAAAADKACEVLGCGSLTPDVGCLSYGTTATINVTSKKYVEAIPLLPAYPAGLRDHYNLEVQIYRGFWMVSWFKEQFGHVERQAADAKGVAPETLFDRMVAGIPPGSMGLVLQPYWSPGLRRPGPEAKGAVIGFGDIHTRGHLYRAILEGIAYALYEGKTRIEKRTRRKITSLRVSGGGSQSKQAMQITADVFGIPAARPHVYETSGLGAAIVAAIGTGLHPDARTAVQQMTHTATVFEPDWESHYMYQRLYQEVYGKLYDRLKPLYHKIRDITGYPR